MEHKRSTDAGCHWRPRSLQVRICLTKSNAILCHLILNENPISLNICRDPRTRRLQEKQQQQQQKTGDAVPEKLSFKEKMKMFALESGENQTPKDKLKISRAQRDIDAVH